MVRRQGFRHRYRVRRGSGKKLRAAFRWRISREGHNGWLQRLAEENPDEAEFIVVEDRPDEAEPEPWHELYWRAWEALRFDRQYGALGGETAISYMAISQYARDHCITAADFGVFHALLTAVDSEWLDYAAERRKEADKK
jgi:hypothetical protein